LELNLAPAAADCLLEIVNKGMDDGEKISAIGRIDAVGHVRSVATSAGEDRYMLGKCAEIANAVGVQCLGVLSDGGGGDTNNNHNYQQATLHGILVEVMEILLQCYNNHYTVGQETLPFLAKFAFTMNLQLKGNKITQQMTNNMGDTSLHKSFVCLDYLPRLLQITYLKMQYPEDYDVSFLLVDDFGGQQQEEDLTDFDLYV